MTTSLPPATEPSTAEVFLPKTLPISPRRSDFGGKPPGSGTPAGEFTLTLCPAPGEGTASVFNRLALALKEREATVLKLMVFGSRDAAREGIDLLRPNFNTVEWPVTWVDGASCDGAPLAGVQAFALAGGKVKRIRLGGKTVGSVYEDRTARYCLLGGLGPKTTALPRPVQAYQAFENLEAALEDSGFALTDVVRTWFYNEELLAWYGDFNRVRTAYYAGRRFSTGSLPASTGISGRNPAGAALAVGAYAVRPLHSSARAMEIASPLQCPAPSYGSSFSRAMEIVSPQRRLLQVSGTASIAPDGRSVWVGDARKQVDLTMEVVEAILYTRNFRFDEVTRATAYFKRRSDVPIFDAWCADRGLLGMAVVRTCCDICRDDLLFEIELDASQSYGAR